MKNRILYIGLSVISALILSSCKNDLDVLAPGDEAVSVYGILNPNAKVQNIRINKVYLTNGDAVTAGQDNATINYGPGELRVSLQRYVNGNLAPVVTNSAAATTEIVLTETVITTADGNFNVNQRLWQTTDKLYTFGEYKLTIKNINTGKEFTAQNVICDSVLSYGQMPFVYVYNPTPQFAYPNHCNGYILDSPPGTGTRAIAYVDYHNLNITQKVKFKSTKNARLYDVVIRFHYIDSLTGGGGNREYVDFNFPTEKSPTLVGGEQMEVSFDTKAFYQNIAAEIAKKGTSGIKNRKAHYMEYIITAGSETLNIFLQVNAPSTSIAQDKPYYTNINGGVGVFASKSSSRITKELHSDFIDEIANNPITQSLMFSKNYAFVCP